MTRVQEARADSKRISIWQVFGKTFKLSLNWFCIAALPRLHRKLRFHFQDFKVLQNFEKSGRLLKEVAKIVEFVGL